MKHPETDGNQRQLTRQLLTTTAALLVLHLKPTDHITDVFNSLHWLRVPERIQYKITLLTYKVLHGSAPQSLAPLVHVVDLPGRRTYRSAGTNRLVVLLSDWPRSTARPSQSQYLECGTKYPKTPSAPSLAVFPRHLSEGLSVQEVLS